MANPGHALGALQGKMQFLMSAAGVAEPALGAAAGLGRWFMGVVVLPVLGDFQRRKPHLATTTHRALPVREWPALSILWGTARSNAASVASSRSGGACTRGFGRGAVQVIRGRCGFASLWRVPEEEAALGTHSTQSPASV